MTICTLLIQIIRESGVFMKKLGPYKKEKWYVVVLSLLIVFFLILFGVLLLLPGKREEKRIMSSVSEEKLIVSASPIPEIPEVTPSYMPEDREVSSAINILDLQEEVVSLLHCTEEQLAGEIKEFLNANGFADVEEVFYEKEIIISHADNTVTVGFYLQREDETYEICCIYNRDTNIRTIEEI